MSIEADHGAVSAHFLDKTITIASNVVKLNLQERTNVLHLLKQISTLNLLPAKAIVKQLNHINILIERSTVGVKTVISRRVETRDASLSTKSDHVGCATIILIQVPVVVGPQLTTLTVARASLIYDEGDTLTSAQSTELFVKYGRG